MSFNDMFVKLSCPNCGGSVEISRQEATEHFVEIEGAYVFLGGANANETIECNHCGQQFVKRHVYRQHGSTVTAQAVGNGAQASAMHTGSITAGTSITANKIVTGIVGVPGNLLDQPEPTDINVALIVTWLDRLVKIGNNPEVELGDRKTVFFRTVQKIREEVTGE